MTDVGTRVARRLRRGWAGLRPARVGVVVVVDPRSTALDECLTALKASTQPLDVVLACPPDDEAAGALVVDAVRRHRPRVRSALPRPGRSWLEAAVDSVRADYLGLVAADDLVPPPAYAALVAALDRSGSDVAVGVQVDVRGQRRRRVPWADTVLRDATALALPDRPGLLVDVSGTGKLFRLTRWRSSAVRLDSWSMAPVAVATLLTGASGLDVLDTVVYERHDRQTSLKVEDQERFRPDVLASRWAAWVEVGSRLGSQPAAVREAWQVGLLEHLLPPTYLDAVGGGPPYLAELAPRVAELLRQVSADVLARVPLPARLGAWAAGFGTLADVALVQDHLADHPHGLPVETGSGVPLAVLPVGLSSAPAEDWRRVEAVDRRLRTRVSVTQQAPGLLRLGGAAFLDYVPGSQLPEVRVGDRDGTDERSVQVRAQAVPDLDAWAARAHEDRGGCGFSAVLTPDDLPGSVGGPWLVSVHLGGQVHRHLVRPPAAEGRVADVVLSELRLDGDDALCADVSTGRPGRVRLTGTGFETGFVELPAASTQAGLRLPLAGVQLGGTALPPSGGYRLDVRSERGEQLTADVPALGDGPLELTGERLRLVVRRTGTGPEVTVASPPGLPDRSALGQQRLLDRTYRSGRLSRPGQGPTPVVLLETFRGRSTGDNPGAVGRALLASDRARTAGLDVAVVVDDPSVVVPPGTRAVVRRTRAWYDALAAADAYVSNAGAPYWFAKAPGQLHVQTWHGTPLKRIGEDRGPGDFSTWRHRRRIAGQAGGWDAMVSPSRYVTDIYRSAFGFTGTVLEVGYPRNDVLLAPDADLLRERVRDRLGIAATDRVVLYAPTWREYVGVRDAKPMYLDAEALVRAVPEAVVLVRGHYNSTTQDALFPRHPRIHDVTRYPDIADLFLAADALVTDYSSVMFDFALTDRPIVLLVPDLDQYRDVERGFYFDIEARSPGPLVTSTADVVDVLTGPDAGSAARAEFRHEFCPFEDGSASTRVVEYCLDRLSAPSSPATPTEWSP